MAAAPSLLLAAARPSHGAMRAVGIRKGGDIRLLAPLRGGSGGGDVSAAAAAAALPSRAVTKAPPLFPLPFALSRVNSAAAEEALEIHHHSGDAIRARFSLMMGGCAPSSSPLRPGASPPGSSLSSSSAVPPPIAAVSHPSREEGTAMLKMMSHSPPSSSSSSPSASFSLSAASLLLPPRCCVIPGGFSALPSPSSRRLFAAAAGGGGGGKGGGSGGGGAVTEHHSSSDHHHEHAAAPQGLYNAPDHHEHHGDGREHLWPDGTRKWSYTTDGFHWDDPYTNVPKQDIVMVNGQKMIKGVETRPLEQLFCVSQANMPFWPRTRLNFWGNYPLVLKAEFLFFWCPTLIIWSLCIPIFTLLYIQDEAIYTTMTVKVIGRQWYWVYEVESPPADD